MVWAVVNALVSVLGATAMFALLFRFLPDVKLRWSDVWAGAPAQAAITALDEALTEFGGDARRMYLTGVSMGAYGAWEIALLNPDRFAALIPICGGLRPIDLYWRMINGIEGTPMPALATNVRKPEDPPEAKKLNAEEIWDIVNYVQSLPYEAINNPREAVPEVPREQQL